MSELNPASVEATLNTANGLLARLFGPAIDEQGQIWQDGVKPRRLRNQIKGFKKALQIAEEEGISPKQINFKVLFPYLEGIAVEEDEDLQTMWAKLIVNYIDPAKNLQVTVFPSILAQLSSEEIKILRFIPRNNSDLDKPDEKPTSIYVDPAAFANIERLGLITHLESYIVMGQEGEMNFATETKIIWKNDCTPSAFGRAFLSACER